MYRRQRDGDDDLEERGRGGGGGGKVITHKWQAAGKEEEEKGWQPGNAMAEKLTNWDETSFRKVEDLFLPDLLTRSYYPRFVIMGVQMRKSHSCEVAMFTPKEHEHSHGNFSVLLIIIFNFLTRPRSMYISKARSHSVNFKWYQFFGNVSEIH